MNEADKLTQLLKEKAKLVAMVAPSFPIVFPYPAIITHLKKLGFLNVVEVAVGAKKTNEELLDLLKNNPGVRYITSPCPTVVRSIRSQMPEFSKYLTHDVDSPMVATAKIVYQTYPGSQPVFVGPCIVKKLEANEDYPDLNILVVTYAELLKVFENLNVNPQEAGNPSDKFDLEERSTRIYPVDGGLAHTSGVFDSMPEGEVQIVSGWENCVAAIKNFDANPKIRLLDILFCEGGCIGGPGIVSNLSAEERKQKVLEFSQTSS